MKNQMKSQGRRVKRGPEQTMPVNTAESDPRGDQLSTALLCGVLLLAAGVLIGGVYWGGTGFYAAVTQAHPDWIHALTMALVVVASVLLARSMAWLSLF